MKPIDPFKSIRVALVAIVALVSLPATAQVVSYHDFGATIGEESTGLITTHQSGPADEGNHDADTTPKALIDFATGSATGVNLQLSQNNAQAFRVDTRTGVSAAPTLGTPAADLFDAPGLNFDGSVRVRGNSNDGGKMVITLTGLDPNLIYDLALYGDRSPINAVRVAAFTLAGADTAVNSSSEGIQNPATTHLETRQNFIPGHVIRWSGIDPGADGTITVTVTAGLTPADNIAYLCALRLEASAGEALPLLKILSYTDDEIEFEWNSAPGRLYDLLTSTDLADPVAEWPIYDDGTTVYEAIPSAGSVTTLSGVAALGPQRFFALRDYASPPPPLLEVDFEGDEGNFTVVTINGTAWAWGNPDSSGTRGSVTGGNDGSAKCWGIGIGNPGLYQNPTTTTLRSPVIDLTKVSGATLTFAEALDLEENDIAQVFLVNDDTDDDIGGAIYTAVDGEITNAEWSAVGPIDISAGVGLKVRLEWRFSGQAPNEDYMGWYIDDVVVTETAP